MEPSRYVLFNGFSVLTDCQEVLDQIGHCFEPSPTGRPVLVFRGQDAPLEAPEGSILYSLPDHASELSSLLGTEIAGEPDGTGGGLAAGAVFSRYRAAVPDSITATQIRLWLVDNGIPLESVSSAIPDGRARVYWEYAPYIERSNPLVNQIGSAIGMSPEMIDSAFIEASYL